MRARPFRQVDVFSAIAYRGNPVAVVLDATGVESDEMAAFARWTNLPETTFVLPATVAGADYRLRIFTPSGEIPFAGHPTLGSAHAWVEHGGVGRRPDELVQECEVGLVRIRREAGRWAFAAPPLRRSGPLEAPLLARIVAGLGIERDEILDHAWVDNGLGWAAVRLASADRVLTLRPDAATLADLDLGVVGPHPPGADAAFEVRAFVPDASGPEDPVTGSLNAGLARWLRATGVAPASYVATQGTAMERAGRVHVEDDGEQIWVGGACASRISGQVEL